MEREPIIKVVIATAGTIAAVLWGEWDMPMRVLLALAVLDYASGVASAFVRNELDSRVGSTGILRKVGMFLVVAACHLVDQLALHIGGMDVPILRSVVASWYAVNEAISVLENWAQVGVPMPERVRQALAVLRDKEGKLS